MALQPRPMEHDPTQIVENVYPINPAAEQLDPDYASRGEMQDFLATRIEGDQSGLRQIFGRWRVYTPVERSRIGFNRWAYLPPVRDGRGWRRATAAGLLALNIGVNLINGNLYNDVSNIVDDAVEEIQGIKDDFQDAGLFEDTDICEPTGTDTTETITRSRIRETFHYTPNPVGESTPNTSVIDQVLDLVEDAQDDGTVRSIKLSIEGNTSDEWLGLGTGQNYGYGQDEAQNEELAAQRQTDSSTLFNQQATARGLDLTGVDIQITHDQNTLSETTLNELTWLATQHGFGSLVEAQRLHNADPASLPADLRAALDVHFSRNRDTVLSVEIAREERQTTIADGPEVTIEEDCRIVDGDPIDENHDYDLDLLPFLWPALPLFMRRRITKMKGSWIQLDGIRDPQRLLIHQDGVGEDSVLDKSAWAYVRKFMYMFREDDRIQKIYEHSYQDEKGEAQSLRALFVDHQPTQETIDMVARTFQFASQIQGGRLGRECDAVVIYKSENAGFHGDAKRVGLGMDVQYQAGIRGVAIPSLGVVELHMPDVPTAAELDVDYNSAAWVLAHELTGHFSDVNDVANRLQHAGHNATGKPVHTLPNRFDTAGLAQFRRGDQEQRRANAEANNSWWRRILRRPLGADSMAWRVRRGRGTLPTPDVAERTVQTVNGTTDPRLREGLHIKKQTGNPTIYGSSIPHDNEQTAASEAWAEAAANAVTNIVVPFARAPEYSARIIRAEDPQRWQDGYHVSTGWNNTLNNRWGSTTPDDETTIFANEEQARQGWVHRMGNPDQFDWARQLGEWARSVEIHEPQHQDWVEIIVGQALKSLETRGKK